MSVKRATLRACGGDVLAAWAADTIRWATESGVADADGWVPWTVSDIARVTGLSYDQAKKAVRRLRETGLVETRRGAVKLGVDFRAVGYTAPDDGGTVPHSTGVHCPRSTYTRYRLLHDGGAQGGRDVVETPFDGTRSDEKDTPEKPKKGRMDFTKMKREKGVMVPEETTVDDLAEKRTSPDNLCRLWQALNVEAGYGMAQGWWAKAWYGKAVAALEQKAGLSILPAVVQVHRRWPEWASHVRSVTGMKAPLVPMLWHVDQNAHLLPDFLTGVEKGAGWSSDPAEDVPADGKLTPEQLADLKAKGVIW